MQTDFNTYSSYFAPTLQPLHPPCHHQSSLKASPGPARMPLSPYTAVPQLHSNPNSGLNQFSSAVRPISSHSHQSPLRQASLGYSPYSSDLSAASAESPLSSSSANESPLPEPSIDNMDYDTSAQVATGNDDYYPCTLSDDIAGLNYPYAHIGARPFPFSGYAVENPEFYKQPIAAPLPMNVSVAMSYSWSPEAKKFMPLCPPIQRQEHNSPNYSTQPSAAAPAHSATGTTCASAQSFGQEIEEADFIYPSQVSSRSYVGSHTHLTQQPSSSLSGYPQLRKNMNVKQETDLHFSDSYNQSADIASSSSDMGLFATLLETGSHNSNAPGFPRNSNYSVHTASPPSESSAALDLTLRYAQSTTNQPPMNVPALSAPVPRHSAYFGTSLVNNCERTCQEQEQERQQQERQALRVQTQGLQEQRTVRPAEVSPIMGFAGLPEGPDDDAEGEADVEPFSLHDGASTGGHSTGRLRDRAEGVFDYPGKLAGGINSETVGNMDMDDEDDEGVEEQNSRDFDDDYKAEERDNDDGDGDFMPHSRVTSKNTRSLRPRSVTGKNPVRYQPYGVDGIPPSAVKRSLRSPHTPPSDMSPSSSGQPGKMRKNARTLPIPVPVPNLTKKSRGRRVPIANATNSVRGQRDAALGARIYLCDVSGCGKCFARGEHLKRHIRSIHTYEKPHKCPYPGCGKEFSRHDNLGQHMKVHKDYPKVLERMKTGEA